MVALPEGGLVPWPPTRWQGSVARPSPHGRRRGTRALAVLRDERTTAMAMLGATAPPQLLWRGPPAAAVAGGPKLTGSSGVSGGPTSTPHFRTWGCSSGWRLAEVRSQPACMEMRPS